MNSLSMASIKRMLSRNISVLLDVFWVSAVRTSALASDGISAFAAALGHGTMDVTASEEHISCNSANLSLIRARLRRSRIFLNGRFLHLSRVVAALHFFCFWIRSAHFAVSRGNSGACSRGNGGGTAHIGALYFFGCCMGGTHF